MHGKLLDVHLSLKTLFEPTKALGAAVRKMNLDLQSKLRGVRVILRALLEPTE